MVEGLYSVRRKWADKRLNFAATYRCRANLAILSAFVDNWQELVLDRVGIQATSTMLGFFQVQCWTKVLTPPDLWTK
jgi:hypothetical protein